MEKLKALKFLSGGSLLFALAQSICTAVLTISAVRVAIGLTALAGAMYQPVIAFHHSAIRAPMLVIAAAGAVINLLVLAWIWRMRRLPSAQWRKREIGQEEKNSERLQVILAVATLILVALETWTHPMLNHGASVF